MKYFLRNVSDADYDFLYRLKVACLKEYVAAIWGWDEPKQKRIFNANFDPEASQIVVAFGRDVGQFSADIRQDEIFLSGLYLLPAYQNQGLGGQIVRDLLVFARERQRPVRLQVLVTNPARRLYQRLGFKVTSKNDTHYVMRYEWSADHSAANWTSS